MDTIVEKLIEKLGDIVERIKEKPIHSLLVVVIFVWVIKWIKSQLFDNEY
jgi:hypothetical protein